MNSHTILSYRFLTFLVFTIISNQVSGYGLGISYNPIRGQNEIRYVDLNDGSSSLLNHLIFSSGYWWPSTLTIDSYTGHFYVISGDNTLYTFDLKTGSVLTTANINTRVSATALGEHGTLLGIAYNAVSGLDDIFSIETSSGTVTLLNSVQFGGNGYGSGIIQTGDGTYLGTGWKRDTFSSDVAANRFYVLTSDNRLYTFDLATGSVLNITKLDISPQAIIYGQNGSLAAISYNGSTNTDEIYRIDTSSGAIELSSSFNFGYLGGGAMQDASGLYYGTGWKEYTFSSDSSSGLIYVMDFGKKVHKFNLNTTSFSSTVNIKKLSETPTVDFSPQLLVAVPESSLSLSAWIINDKGQQVTKPDNFEISDPSATITATIPLGGTISFQLTQKDSDGKSVPVPAKFSVSSQTINPPIANIKQSLFPKNAVLGFGDEAAVVDTKQIQAVHLGTATLTITPENTALAPINITITVTNTISEGQTIPLGKDNNYYDTGIMKIAHERGIPPQFIKGQMNQESKSRDGKFNPYAYRYEPLSSRTGDYRTISREKDYRTQPIYKDYRLATLDGLTMGEYTNSDDISSRTKSSPAIRFVTNQGKSVPVSDEIGPDDPISIKQIFDGYPDDKFKWCFHALSSICTVKDGLDPKVAKILENTTAQTTLAASYGLLQVMYVNAIGDPNHLNSQWKGINGRFNPSFLFDTPENISNGGGSMVIGTYKTFVNYKRINKEPDIKDLSHFSTTFINAFQNYNREIKNYGDSVILKSRRYIPKLENILE